MGNSIPVHVDTHPPGTPILLINNGLLSTASSDVVVSVYTGDYESRPRDVKVKVVVRLQANTTPPIEETVGPEAVIEMRVWGDVDPTFDARIAAFEVDSDWMTVNSNLDVRLSSGAGRKRIYARLRDGVGNTSPVFGSAIEYDPDLPQVSVVVEPLATRVSMEPGHDEVSFSWECNTDFVEYKVRVMPTTASPYFGGSDIADTNGSVNVAGTGTFAAATPITSLIKTGDLIEASGGDSRKVIKVFVKDALGRWSP